MAIRKKTPAPRPPRKKAPVAVAQVAKQQIPSGQPFRGKERLVTLKGNVYGDPVIETYHWNPGLERTFTVGHHMASAFNKYRITKPGNNMISWISSSPTTQSGTVYIFIEYDPSDKNPTTQDEFADNQHSHAASVWDSLNVKFDSASLNKSSMIVRDGSTTQSLLLTDACKIHVAAFGYGSTTNELGHAYITYDAVLMSRQPPSIGLGTPRNIYMVTRTSNQSITSAGETVIEFDDLKYNEIVGASLMTTGGIRLPRGIYKLTYNVALDMSQSSSSDTSYMEARVRVDGVVVTLASVVYVLNHLDGHTLPLNMTGAVIELESEATLTIIVNHTHPETIAVVGERTSAFVELIADG